MTRTKKEEIRKYKEARIGLTPQQIVEFDAKEAKEKLFKEDVRWVNHILYHEDFDHMYDNIADAKDRARGISPMNDEYHAKIKNKNKAIQAFQILSSDKSVGSPSIDICEYIVLNEYKKGGNFKDFIRKLIANVDAIENGTESILNL